MARPKKTGLTYFPMDVDILADMKIIKICHKAGGGMAFAIYVSLLCDIYKNGYYLEYDEDTAFKTMVSLAEKDDVQIDNIIHRMVEYGLFDAQMFEKFHVLTSTSIQERYLNITAQTKRNVSITLYNCLVSAEETAVNSEETTINKEKTSITTDITPKNSGKTPQIKLKENERKILTSSSPRTHARGEEEGQRKEDVAGATSDSTLDDQISAMKSSGVWQDEICKKYGINVSDLEKKIDEFRSECIIRMNTSHEDMKDISRHFDSWMTIQLSKQTQQPKNYGRQQTNPAPAAGQGYDRRRAAPISLDAPPEAYEKPKKILR